MDDLEEFESWYEDLVSWECFQEEHERMNGGNISDKLQNSNAKRKSSPHAQFCIKHSKAQTEQMTYHNKTGK